MAIIGSILGDIIGSQYEFPMMRPKNLKWNSCELFTDECKFTDDTVMSIATMDCVNNTIGEENDFAKYYRMYGKKYPNMSYGSKFRSWISDSKMKDYGSYGNGSAMRVAYIGEFAKNEKECDMLSYYSAICTHSHQEGIIGSTITAMSTYMAKHGASKKEIFNYINKYYNKDCGRYCYPISESLSSYRENYQWNETCQNSVPVALRCFIESEDYESFIRNVMSLKCDMDTLCAIGGGLAEEFYNGTGFDNSYLLNNYLDGYLLNKLKENKIMKEDKVK
jgi:ADP-ribosylglycohydrolase